MLPARYVKDMVHHPTPEPIIRMGFVKMRRYASGTTILSYRNTRIFPILRAFHRMTFESVSVNLPERGIFA